jgi:hypothetical protein
MDLPIWPSDAQHGDDRKQDDADSAVNLPFGAPPIRDGGKELRKITRRNGATSATGCSL